MAKKVVDQDAYDVSPAVTKATLKLLEDLTKDLEAGCRSVEKDAKLTDDAIGTFRRRYRLSLQRVLTNPETAKLDHRRVLGPAMKCHGRVAASIAGFHRAAKGPLMIDRDTFLKAAFVIEGECKAFALRASLKHRGAAAMEPIVVDTEVSKWVYCW